MTEIDSERVSKLVPELDLVDAVISKFSGDKSALIAILQEIENSCGYLPAWALRQVSQKLAIPLTQVYGVACFYDAFHLKPKGRHTVRVCLGTACYLRGSARVQEAVEGQLGARDGETTSDSEYTVQSVRCLGACSLAPVMVIDEKYYDKMTPTRARKVLKRHGEEEERK